MKTQRRISVVLLSKHHQELTTANQNNGFPVSPPGIPEQPTRRGCPKKRSCRFFSSPSNRMRFPPGHLHSSSHGRASSRQTLVVATTSSQPVLSVCSNVQSGGLVEARIKFEMMTMGLQVVIPSKLNGFSAVFVLFLLWCDRPIRWSPAFG